MAALRHAFRVSAASARASVPSHSAGNWRSVVRGLATAQTPPSSPFSALDTFTDRHIGPDDHEVSHMLSQLGYESMDAFIAAAVPSKIRITSSAVSNESIPSLSESELYRRAKQLGNANKPFRSYIGMGYHNAVVPPVVLRNVCDIALP